MALKIENLTGGYSQLPVLHQVSFDVQAGELVGLIGLNGAGKSTTINHVIGLLKPFSGQISLNGVELSIKNKLLMFQKRQFYIQN